MDCMQQDWLLWTYLFGVAVYGTALIAKVEFMDIFCSYLAALAWPVSLPAELVRRMLR